MERIEQSGQRSADRPVGGPDAAAEGEPDTVTSAKSQVRKRSVLISGHRTSVSLEDQFWEALKEIAGRRGLSLNDLIAEIDRGRAGNLSSAIRCHVLSHYREQLRDTAHA